MSSLLTPPWSTESSNKTIRSNSTESFQDEEEVFPDIDEEILNQLPPRLQRNLRILQQEAYDRLSRTNPKLVSHMHQRPASQHESVGRAPATPQENSKNLLTTHRERDDWPLPAMDEGSSRYLSIRNPDRRGSPAGTGNEDSGGKGKKRVKFNLPDPEPEDEGENEEQDGAASGGRANPIQGPVAEENFDHFEDHRPTRLEATGLWTASARFRNVLSGEATNPYAPYTSGLREEARASVMDNLGDLDDESPKKKRKPWFHRFLKFIGLKGRKDKKP